MFQAKKFCCVSLTTGNVLVLQLAMYNLQFISLHSTLNTEIKASFSFLAEVAKLPKTFIYSNLIALYFCSLIVLSNNLAIIKMLEQCMEDLLRVISLVWNQFEFWPKETLESNPYHVHFVNLLFVSHSLHWDKHTCIYIT